MIIPSSTKTNLEYEYYSGIGKEDKFNYFKDIYRFLYSLNNEYTNFALWYKNNFDDKYEVKKEREIIVCREAPTIVAVAILKKTDEENKICTLRVAKDYQGNGIGTNLINLSINHLEEPKPLISLNSYRKDEFKRIFKHFGFKPEQESRGLYRKECTEISYNGILTK